MWSRVRPNCLGARALAQRQLPFMSPVLASREQTQQIHSPHDLAYSAREQTHRVEWKYVPSLQKKTNRWPASWIKMETCSSVKHARRNKTRFLWSGHHLCKAPHPTNRQTVLVQCQPQRFELKSTCCVKKSSWLPFCFTWPRKQGRTPLCSRRFLSSLLW